MAPIELFTDYSKVWGQEMTVDLRQHPYDTSGKKQKLTSDEELIKTLEHTNIASYEKFDAPAPKIDSEKQTKNSTTSFIYTYFAFISYFIGIVKRGNIDTILLCIGLQQNHNHAIKLEVTEKYILGQTCCL